MWKLIWEAIRAQFKMFVEDRVAAYGAFVSVFLIVAFVLYVRQVGMTADEKDKRLEDTRVLYKTAEEARQGEKNWRDTAYKWEVAAGIMAYQIEQNNKKR